MSTPTSLPVIPAQPALPTYGFPALALFTSYSRASFLAQFSVQAPNWNPAFPAKYWFDTSGTAPSSYLMPDLIDPTGTSGEQPLTINDPITGLPRALTLAEAAAVNIPGLQTYPPYEIAPSDIIQQSTGAILTGTYLSTFAQAVALCAAVGLAVSFGGPGATIVDMDPGGEQAYTYPATEQRRWYGIIWQGQPLTVGTILAQQNSQGVGYPGTWNLTGSTPTFVFAQPGPDGITSGAPTSTVPVPVRPLLTTEYFEQVLGGSEILNTNLIQPPSSTGGTTVGDYTAADRASAAATAALVLKIAAALGISTS